jgi:excisionase family DNA binding protein
MEQYLTSEQVAKQLQVHPFTVLKYLKSGKLKGVKIGRMYRIKESDVEKFLAGAETTVEAPSEPRSGEDKKTEPEPKQPKEPAHKIEFLDDEEPKAEHKEEYYKI